MQKGLNITELEPKVKKILSEKLSLPVDKISLESSLVNDLGMDSFAAIEVMFAADTEFGIKITQDEISKFTTVNDIVEKVKELIKTKK